VQIRASAASGGRSLSQHSQLGLSFSILPSGIDSRVLKPGACRGPLQRTNAAIDFETMH
jgi:hypothetical protein